MKAYQVKFYVYADSQQQADQLEQTLYAFVDAQRGKGVAVTADRLAAALRKYGDNYFVTQFLKSK
jgi:hypothetical protein